MTKYHVDIDYPPMELKINRKGLIRQIGNSVAKAVRARLDSGNGADGTLPTDLKDTGEMLRSVKFRPSRRKGQDGKWKSIEQGAVFPTRTRLDNGKKNAMILAVNLHRNPALRASSPMGMDEALREKAREATRKAIADQVRRREIRLAKQAGGT